MRLRYFDVGFQSFVDHFSFVVIHDVVIRPLAIEEYVGREEKFGWLGEEILGFVGRFEGHGRRGLVVDGLERSADTQRRMDSTTRCGIGLIGGIVFGVGLVVVVIIVWIELSQLALWALALTETRRRMEDRIDVGDGTVVGGIVKGGGGGGEVHFE
jgi:hypothetical protein